MSLDEMVIILAPDTKFNKLAHHLMLTGWVREPDRTHANVGQTEPVFVSWSRPMSDDEIDYSYDPELGFRLLEIRGEDSTHWCEDICSVIDRLSAKQILGLLRSIEPKQKLLGLKIAATLREPVFVPEIIRLAKDDDLLVKEKAREIISTVLPLPTGSADEIHAAFDAILDVQQRRQVVRWILHDNKQANASIIAALESALIDPDWEVRATAMLAVARYDLKQLSLLLKDCQMPTVSRLGPLKFDREILHAAKQAVLFQFVGKALMQPTQSASEREKILYHLRCCVAGLPTERKDHVWLFIQSLTEPLKMESLPPESLPPGVEQTTTGYVLKGTDINLCWVAPVPHYLGDDEPNMPMENPIRQFTPDNGFFIAKTLHYQTKDDETPIMYSYEQAKQFCQTLSACSGAVLRLPTRDEWECAARGTDGRRFPWGNGYEALWQITPSPWGCLELMGVAPQWLQAESPLVGGSERVIPCAHINNVTPDGHYAVRIVVACQLSYHFKG